MKSAIHGRIARESNTNVFDSSEPSTGMTGLGEFDKARRALNSEAGPKGERRRRESKRQDSPFSITNTT